MFFTAITIEVRGKKDLLSVAMDLGGDYAPPKSIPNLSNENLSNEKQHPDWDAVELM
jgi:hypothetical protein